ncbi:hypothetical protein Q31b_52870 [Novipirellula aureliae]|uniref:Uncharacterized protein n=1 Tax=Novipirellula aureliae TaxID=2527966 RepID=A0A5C6DHK7_9BACT|nr:hypothetical protein [Novipirellula aureliae]TWU35191.1 hypothetical protein Q31b_52870 [Novipirellula aureliae]
MAVAKFVQLLWAAFFVLTIGLRAIASGSLLGVSFGVVSVVYLVATLACLANSRLGWIVALAVPILPLLRWTPMVVINFWMFFTGHELYQDSPATIFIVAINAIMFVLPGLLIYLCLFLDRKRLLAAMRPPVTITDSADPSGSIVLETRSPNPYTPPRT